MNTPTTISQFVPHQLGMTYIVRENYPLFMDFISAYYEWLELDGNALQRIMILKDQRDVDKTLEEFLVYFQSEFLPSIPTTVLTDKRQLVKHIKDFYKARGSEKSFRFLFRILYNEDLSFYYPKIDMLVPSDGKWTTDTIIRTTTTGDTSKFVARTIRGVTSGATAGVENVVQILIGSSLVSEIYISNLTGNFSIGETIHVTTPDNVVHSETVYGIATGIVLTNDGTGYKQDDIITVIGGNQTAIFAVDVVSGIETGRVVAAGQANFPVPATLKLALTASSVDNFFQNMTVQITEGKGIGQFKTITQYNGTSKVAIVDGSWVDIPDVSSRYSIQLGHIKTTKVKDFGINYSSTQTANFTNAGKGDATGTVTFGAVGRYAGRFANEDGFLSSTKRLQDSFYYQAFSYVLNSKLGIAVYRNIVKNILHPASLALFGTVNINSVPNGRKTHIGSSSVTSETFDSGSLSTLNLVAQYSCVQNLIDTQLVYDVSGSYPTGKNAVLGDFHSIETVDPTFVAQGLQVRNTYANAAVVPIDLGAQTLIVAFSASSLPSRVIPVGSIDLTKDSGVSGYQISINPDGSLTFRVQKITTGPVTNNLIVNYAASSILTSHYYFAGLRYGVNTLTGNLGQLAPVTNAFSTNVDGLTAINNSRGYFLGAGGFPEPALGGRLYGRSLLGSTLMGIPGSPPSFSGLLQGYFDGIIAYVMIYNRYLSDDEMATAYLFVKSELNSRGITLS